MTILAIDDDKHVLDRLSAHFPSVEAVHIEVTKNDDVTFAHEQALAALRRTRPTSLILDLEWTGKPPGYLDGLRFLRHACAEELLRGVELVLYSRYLDHPTATTELLTLEPLLQQSGVTHIVRVPKSELPQLLGGRDDTSARPLL